MNVEIPHNNYLFASNAAVPSGEQNKLPFRSELITFNNRNSLFWFFLKSIFTFWLKLPNIHLHKIQVAHVWIPEIRDVVFHVGFVKRNKIGPKILDVCSQSTPTISSETPANRVLYENLHLCFSTEIVKLLLKFANFRCVRGSDLV